MNHHTWKIPPHFMISSMIVMTLIVLWGTRTLASESRFPTPLGYVSDYADIVSLPWESQIRSVCKDLENRTGVEMIVVTISSIAPLAHAQEYAAKLYEEWRIGTAQQERGIVLLTAVKERQAVVVLGRNLLSVISRKQLDALSHQHLVPMFRSQNFGEHI